MKIAIIGKVSVGKSSFLNSLYNMILEKFKIFNNLLIAPMHYKRETFNPIKYTFSDEYSEFDYKFLQENNNQSRKHEESLKEEYSEFNIIPKNNHISEIVDFPGFDDGKSGDWNYSLENFDLILFITDANRAFIDSSEVEFYKKVPNKCVIIVNKFDTPRNRQLNDIYEDLPNPKYRWCSYARFKKMKIEDINYDTISSPCDIDNFMDTLFKNKIDGLTIVDFFPTSLLEKIREDRELGSLRLVYKWLDNTDLKSELIRLNKTDILELCRILHIKASDKESAISKILEIKHKKDSFINIFANLPIEEEKSIREKTKIYFNFKDYYEFFGLNMLDLWTVPHLTILAKVNKIPHKGKKTDILNAILKYARN